MIFLQIRKLAVRGKVRIKTHFSIARPGDFSFITSCMQMETGPSWWMKQGASHLPHFHSHFLKAGRKEVRSVTPWPTTAPNHSFSYLKRTQCGRISGKPTNALILCYHYNNVKCASLKLSSFFFISHSTADCFENILLIISIEIYSLMQHIVKRDTWNHCCHITGFSGFK